MPEEEAEGGERSHAERWCGCSAPSLTERAPTSRAWDDPAVAEPPPRPAPPHRRGSPGTKVAAAAGQRARGVGAVSPSPRSTSFCPALWEFSVDLQALACIGGSFPENIFLEGAGIHLRRKKKENILDSSDWL